MKNIENNYRKMLLSVLGVTILTVAVIGISFAAYVGTKTSEVNKISTGTITFSYAEPTNGITLNNAVPVSDSVGKQLNNTFDFTVNTTTTNALTIPYVVTMTKANATEGELWLSDSDVTVYVTKNNDDVALPETKVSDLTTFDRNGDSSNTKLLFDSSHIHNSDVTNNTISTNYTFRMWVNQSANLDGVDSHVYKVFINVDSAIKGQ